MIGLTIWQMFELIFGTIAFFLFLALFLLLSWSARNEGGGSLSGCCIILLLPLGFAGIYLILDALVRAAWHV